MAETVYDTELVNLKICPSDNNLIGAEIELVSEIARESKLKMAIDQVKDNFDYILIDCPPSLGLFNCKCIKQFGLFSCSLQTEYFAMEGLAQLVNTVKLVRSSLNP